MAESSRCIKYGGRHETVPRHICHAEGCEFDYPDLIESSIALWESMGLNDLAEQERRKLKFSQERAGRA